MILWAITDNLNNRHFERLLLTYSSNYRECTVGTFKCVMNSYAFWDFYPSFHDGGFMYLDTDSLVDNKTYGALKKSSIATI